MICWTLSAKQHSHKVEQKHDLTTFLLVAISHHVTCSEISTRMIEISKCMMDFHNNILVTDLSFFCSSCIAEQDTHNTCESKHVYQKQVFNEWRSNYILQNIRRYIYFSIPQIPAFGIISMASCKTAVSPLLTHWIYWRYCSPALSHRRVVKDISYQQHVPRKPMMHPSAIFRQYQTCWYAALKSTALLFKKYFTHRTKEKNKMDLRPVIEFCPMQLT